MKRKYLLSSAFLPALLLLMLIGCTKIQTMEFDILKSEVLNTTRLENNESRLPASATTDIEQVDLDNLAPDELVEPYSGNITKGLCAERVLIGLRECHWINNTLNITIKNPGLKNVTMIFYIMSGSDTITNVSSDLMLAEKYERSYLIPLNYLAYKNNIPFDEIDKVYATPVLSEDGNSKSCSNKNLPILLGGCRD